ncbi:MAG: LPS assembly protein LptD, partial [Planctomycetes bacterium]|nr:LPS assembly protein LptD [Planctomycetota bacterium]
MKFPRMLSVYHQMTSVFACALFVASASGQTLVPLGDEVSDPLVPAGVSHADVEMFGEMVYLWRDPQGANVVHFVGDFELQLGARRLNARQAVIWITPQKHKNAAFTRLEIVLWRDARVRDAAGTVMHGPALFVTLNAAGKIRTAADLRSHEPSSDTAIYERAKRIREALAGRRTGVAPMGSPMSVIDLGRRADAEELEVRPPVSFQGRDLVASQTDDGRSIVTVIGDVIVFRGAASPDGDPLELRADAAVVYLADRAAETKSESATDDRPGRVQRGKGVGGEDGGDGASSGSGMLGGIGDAGVFEGGAVESVYLEGDIVLSNGEQMIRASRLYYDFTNDRALVLDAVMRMLDPVRSLPIYVRADSIRQLSAREFLASDAKFTTSEFYTPHYHIGAEELKIVDKTPSISLAPRQRGVMTGTYEARKPTLNISNVPIMFWPYARGNISDTETSLKNVRTGFSNDFGMEFQTRWELFNVLGLERPDGFDGTFRLDYFSKRGPGVGANLDYETDKTFGLFRGYGIRDGGRDNLGGRFRNEEPDSTNRGRLTWRHREYLDDDWQLTLEASYISDRNFLEEFYEQEFDKGKEQETLLFLKKQRDNWAFTAQLQYRILDFLTQTERLPDLSFRLIGESIGDRATLFSENRLGVVRFRPAYQERFLRRLVRSSITHGRLGFRRLHDSGAVMRADSRQEIEVPFSLGDVRLVPFASIRGSAWDDSPEKGGVQRAMGTYGIRASHYLWKAYPDARSHLFDINGVRHIIKTDLVAWAADSNQNQADLYPFDEVVEGIGDTDGVTFGVRQRFQTKRGAPGRQRTVDFLTFDVEVGIFNDAPRRNQVLGNKFTNGFASYSRPENSIAQNYVNTSLLYRINDSTTLASEMNFDLNDGEVDVLNLTYTVERSPRLSYLVGYRYIGEIDSNLLGLG